jgi:hypothetical protein
VTSEDHGGVAEFKAAQVTECSVSIKRGEIVSDLDFEKDSLVDG